MINERNSTQANPSTSTNMSYGYPTNRFDLMNMSPMQNPNDLYSYYPTNVYQPFNRFDDHNQWGSADTSNGIPPLGPLPYHPQIYSPTGLDLSHNTFDYPPPPAPPTYPSYHPGFTPTTNTSTFDMSWNLPNLPVQQQQIPLIGNTSNKKSTIYDDYSTTNSNISDMLVQQMNSVNLGNNDTQNFNILSSKEQQQQQQYVTNSNNLSFTRPAQISSGPKSYASVVSSDSINSSSNRIISSNSNLSIRSANEKNSNTQNQTYPSWLNKSDRLTNSTSTTATTNQENLDHQYNPKDFNLNSKGARFFVIKSYSEDDIHRSIKYGIWCSTEHGNKRLDTAYREREGKGPIYLFFSVNASGHFCGIAQMMSPIDYEHQTDVWHMSNKWQGKFEVKWIYVKDVPNQQFRNIRLENNENKPVTNSRDTQEIPYEKGKLMLKTFHMYRHKTSIFDDFQYYESKQAEETTTKKSSNRDFNNNNNNKSLPSNRLAKTDQEDIQN